MKQDKLLPHYQFHTNYTMKNVVFIGLAFLFLSRLALFEMGLQYHQLLWSVDVPVSILSLLYIGAIKPMILNGTIPAYYKESYELQTIKNANLFVFFAASAIGRLIPAVIGIQSINIPSINLAVAGSAVLFSLYILTSLYYDPKRFISIKRYSEGTKIIMYSKKDKYAYEKMNEMYAGKRFIREYRAYLNNEEINKRNKMTEGKTEDPVLSEIFRDEVKVDMKKINKDNEANNLENPTPRRQSRNLIK